VINDLLMDEGIGLLRLRPEDMTELVQAANRFKLDFDDAYQYVLVRRHNLDLISYDSDFNKTDLKKLTPEDALILMR
jgi:predicted nucleic acid-binding protein